MAKVPAFAKAFADRWRIVERNAAPAHPGELTRPRTTLGSSTAC